MKKNYVPQPMDTSDIQLPEELNVLIEQMAKNVHEVWAEEIAAETQALDMLVEEVAEAVEVAAEEYVVPEVAVASPVEEESAWDQY